MNSGLAAHGDFVQRIVLERERVVLQCHASLFSRDVGPDAASATPDGFDLPPEMLLDIGASGSGTFVRRGGPGDKAIRRIGAWMHASLIHECGYAVEPMPEVARKSPASQDQNVFVCISDGRAVGLLVTRNYARFFLQCVATGSDFVRPDCRLAFGPAGHDVRGVEGLWVAKNHRCAGVACLLLDAAAEYHEKTPGEFVYRLPFSRAGLRYLVCKIGPRFLASLGCAIKAVPIDDEHRLLPCHVRVSMPCADDATIAVLEELERRSGRTS